MSKDITILYPNAKLNLNLFIGEKEKTWWDKLYHKIFSVIFPITLYDRIVIKPGDFNVRYIFNDEEKKISISQNGIENCILKKVIKVFEIDEKKLDFELIVEKNIPLSSGLGGGSADAAFFIKYLIDKKIIQIKSKTQLFKKACEVGSDVPFFLVNKPSIVYGFGEKVIPLKLNSNIYFVIIQAFEKISTQVMYDELDNIENRKILNKNYEKKFIKKIKKYLQNNKNYAFFLKEIANNDFELIVANKNSFYKDWKLEFKNPLFVNLSGAGPSIFGVYTDYVEAKNCYDILKNIHGRVYICSCKI